MGLRRQLLLFASLFLVLPVIGWQTARQIESALRASEETALLAVADSLVRGLEPQGVLAAARGPALYVHRIDHPISIDGFDDDWRSWLESPRRFQAARSDFHVSLYLAANLRRLYGLLLVGDRIRSSEDHVLLMLADGRRFRIEPGIPGRAEVRPVDDPPAATPLQAAWEDGAGGGYTVEFSIPRTLAGDRLGVAASDAGGSLIGGLEVLAGTVVDGRITTFPIVVRSRALSDRLQEIAPPGSRLWVVDDDGWVLGAGGRLADVDGASVRGWRRLVYDWLSDEVGSTMRSRDPATQLRLVDREVRSALRGDGSVRLQSIIGAASLVASVAVPVIENGQVMGALVLESPTESLLLAANQAFVGTVLASLGAVALLAIGLLAFAGVLSMRIRRLRDAADAVARGERESLPPSHATDEIGDLSRSFQQLLGELAEYNRYLRGLAGRLAHELGTPLAVIRSSLDNLQHESLPDSADAYVERARDGAERLRAILMAMSEARRLEQAVGEAEFEVVDACDVVRGCFQAYRDLDPGHRWRLVLEVERVMVRASPELLAQALDKLTDNARSFAPAGGEIIVAVRPKGRGVTLRVANDGPPLPDKLGTRVFDSMVSVRSRSSGFHLGLGLHIVRLIAHAHGGKVTARNRGQQRGAELVIWLPGL